MNFKADEYFQAAAERMRQARLVYRSGENYALAMYCAGLAVECLLRAFRWRKDQSFEGRHDLHDLLKASDLLAISEDWERGRGSLDDDILETARALRAAMSQVVILWHNNLRFTSEKRLRAFLLQIDRIKGIKGNAVKKNASDLLEAAQAVVDRGVLLWTSKKK